MWPKPFEIPREGPLTRSVHSFNHGRTALRLRSHYSQLAVLERVHRSAGVLLRRERSSPETRQATDAGAHAFPARRQRARTRSVATSHTQESAACDGRPSRRTEDAARGVSACMSRVRPVPPRVTRGVVVLGLRRSARSRRVQARPPGHTRATATSVRALGWSSLGRRGAVHQKRCRGGRGGP